MAKTPTGRLREDELICRSPLIHQYRLRTADLICHEIDRLDQKAETDADETCKRFGRRATLRRWEDSATIAQAPDPIRVGPDTGVAMPETRDSRPTRPSHGTPPVGGSQCRAVSTDSTDGELAMALIAKDPDAARIVWERFLPVVRGMTRKALGLYAEIDDVVQEVFAVVFRNVHHMREPGAFRAFVITVTRRKLGHEIRRARARARLHAASRMVADDAVSEQRDPASRHAYIHFQRLLARLKERDRRAFMLRYVERMEATEIALALGVSVPTARRAFARAQNRMFLWAERHAFLSDYLAEEALPFTDESAAFEADTAA